MIEATQRPWRVDDEQIIDADGKVIATLRQRGPLLEMVAGDHVTHYLPETEANAELIVRAVNAHDALVAALEAYVAAEVPEMQSEHFQERVKAAGPRGAAVVAAYHEALAALALARGGGQG